MNLHCCIVVNIFYSRRCDQYSSAAYISTFVDCRPTQAYPMHMWTKLTAVISYTMHFRRQFVHEILSTLSVCLHRYLACTFIFSTTDSFPLLILNDLQVAPPIIKILVKTFTESSFIILFERAQVATL